MEILTSPSPAPEPDLAQQTAREIRNHVQATWRRMQWSQAECFRLLWNHPTLTPQQVCDALGAEASQLFAVGGDLSTLILKYDPAYPEANWMPPVMPVFHEDGTVTIPDPGE